MTTDVPTKSNRRRYIIIAVAVLLFGCCGISALSLLATPDDAEPAATAVPAAPTPAIAEITAAAPTVEAQWVEVLRVEATGDKKTEDFTVTGNQWRVSWDVAGERLLNADAVKSDGSGSENAIDCWPCGKGDTIMRGAGTYYLDITGGGDGYTIIVEDRR